MELEADKTPFMKRLCCTIILSIFSYCFGNDSVPAMRLESALMFLFKDELGYTLIGEKPVSVNNCQNLDLIQNKELAQCVFRFLEKAFDKSDTYILKVMPVFHGLTYVQLVHKRALSNLISKEKSLQAFIKQNYGSARRLFHALKDPQKTIFDCFQHNPEILGLVFGYGKSNTDYFMRFNKVGFYLKKYPRVRLFSFPIKPHVMSINANRKVIRFKFEERSIPPKPLPRFKSLEEEWKWICRIKAAPWKDTLPPPPHLFRVPYYKGRMGKEAEKVKRHFIQAKDKLAKLFCGRKFSEVIAEEAAKK